MSDNLTLLDPYMRPPPEDLNYPAGVTTTFFWVWLILGVLLIVWGIIRYIKTKRGKHDAPGY